MNEDVHVRVGEESFFCALTLNKSFIFIVINTMYHIYMIILNINYILTIVIILFLIGVLELVLNKKNILITLMSIELMLFAINLNFVIFSIYSNDITGYVFVLFILTIAAAEYVIGLAILTIYYRLNNNNKKFYSNERTLFSLFQRSSKNDL